MILKTSATALLRTSISLMALAASATGMPAMAQEAAEDDTDGNGEIIVQGAIITAQGESIAQKRNADNLIDISAADSVGRFPDQTQSNLKAMLDELKKREIPVVLTGMIAAPNLGQDYASKFNPIYPALAKQYDAGLYPFFLDGVITDKTLMLPDGIHPTAEGHKRLASNVWEVLAGVL